jgi:hypothetical protein
LDDEAYIQEVGSDTVHASYEVDVRPDRSVDGAYVRAASAEEV